MVSGNSHVSVMLTSFEKHAWRPAAFMRQVPFQQRSYFAIAKCLHHSSGYSRCQPRGFGFATVGTLDSYAEETIDEAAFLDSDLI